MLKPLSLFLALTTVFSLHNTLQLLHPNSVAPQIATIVEQITVRIDGQNPGSGVLLAKQGQTYFAIFLTMLGYSSLWHGYYRLTLPD